MLKTLRAVGSAVPMYTAVSETLTSPSARRCYLERRNLLQVSGVGDYEKLINASGTSVT